MATPPRPPHHRLRPHAAFTMAEMLVVMAIITILAASLAVVLPKIRTMSMVRRAESDIRNMSFALDQYHSDIGHYPTAPNTLDPNACGDTVLYHALCNRHAGGESRGWGAAKTEWDFIRTNNIGTYTYASRAGTQILDPWNVPYYYICSADYLRGVRIYEDPTSAPIIFAATERSDDYRGDTGDTGAPDTDRNLPRYTYYGPPPKMEEFYNPQTYQIHSKGPDQQTDIDDDDATNIDPCDRGTDGDDVNNYAK